MRADTELTREYVCQIRANQRIEVRSLERGTYGVPGERVVPLLAILTAAAG